MTRAAVPVFVSVWAPGLQAVRTRFNSRFIRSLSPCVPVTHAAGVQHRSVSMSAGGSDINGVHRETGVIPADLEQEMSRSYMEYAMSVILGRAMPDVRDGLKPVHRRILFAMHELGLTSGGQFRKSARVVGEVLGKYHPHGDTAVYDALVRMAQDFSMSIPLVNGHGNFGSTDGDPAAAMRYTECKLATMSMDVLLADMGRDTVSYIPNFDGSENEPLVLPARVPNLLVNGSSGIAVGMATNIPPHNLGEIVNALSALIQDPNISDDELMSIVPAPDFPTGGQILGLEGARDMYLTGRGRILMRACAHSEVLDAGTSKRRQSRDAIVVTELPYQVNKSVLIGKIAELVNEKKLEGVSDLRDESDRNGTRIVIELKRDAKVAVVMNNLFKKTQLQSSFSANVMALDNGRFPVRLTLRDCLSKFLTFRRETVRRRVRFDLKRAEARLHLTEGFLIVQQNIEEVVKDIRASKDGPTARGKLINRLGLSSAQADAVLNMQLRRLTALEYDRLEKESKNLRDSIAEYESILANADKLDAIILGELGDIGEKYSKQRRSIILQGNRLDAADISDLSLMSNERSVIIVTQKGYVKRMPISAFHSQNRGTRGKRGLGRLRDGDEIAHFFTCMTHDSLIAISKSGVAYDLSAHKVPLSSLGSRGVPMFQLLPAVPAGETMASVIPVSEYREDEYLVLLTRCGFVKKTSLSLFKTINARGKRIILLDAQDELKWIRKCTANDSLIIASQFGFVIRFRTDNKALRASGRSSRGVRSMRLRVDGDCIADMDVIPGEKASADVVEEVELSDDDEEWDEDEAIEDEAIEDEAIEDEDEEVEKDDEVYLLAVSSQGIGKRMRASMFRTQGRGGRGVIGIKLQNTNRVENVGHAGSAARRKKASNRLVALQRCDREDSVMLVTRDGNIVRTRVGKIPVYGRFTQGVKIQKLAATDTVAAVAMLPTGVVEDDEDEGDSEN